MDKKSRRYYVLFLTLQLFLPLCTGLGYLIHRPFVLTVPWLELLLLSAAAVFLTRQLRREAPCRWLILLLPLSILNGFFLLLQGWLGGVSTVVCLVCGWLMLEHAPKGFLRGLCYVLCLLLTVGYMLILPVWFFVQAMGGSETVRKVDSPEKRYTAIVRSIDQGALGGDTVVEVRDNRRSIHILLGRFVDSTELWQGGWGEHEGMTLLWEDGETLEINGISYAVSGEDAALIADISHTLGAEIPEGQVLEYWDDHGGFLGDGSTFVKIQGSCAVPDSAF